MEEKDNDFEENQREISYEKKETPSNVVTAQKYSDESVAHTAFKDELDEKMGFLRYQEGPTKLGWLVNMHPTVIPDHECPTGKAGIDLYFIEEDGSTFKASMLYQPYFFVICKNGAETDVQEFLKRRFERTIASVTKLVKDDLELPNHISVQKRTVLKVSFWNSQQLSTVKSFLFSNIDKSQSADGMATSSHQSIFAYNEQPAKRYAYDGIEGVIECREYDLMYYTRVAIDNDIRVGLWYNVEFIQGNVKLVLRSDILKRADPVVLAYDIETTKLPLRFPDVNIDSIMMISYMIDGQGFLITNREIVSCDIEDFEYTPKPEFEGYFTVFNEQNEEKVIRRFLEHIQVCRPNVFVTYNGDFFDWPFVEGRARVHGIDLMAEIGFFANSSDEFTSNYASHMDCFAWVKRDSYLPQGSQNLKAVTTNKLGYNPMEIDPEDMTRFASEQPQTLAQYSVSDAVATYYLYMKYVHPFIFSLCNIIPMSPDDVLRRGSGTLCEHLLMVQAFKSNVIMPNKHQDQFGRTFEGHLLESETYVGGHVEALEAGIFRSDLPAKFKLDPNSVQQLIDEIDLALSFSIIVEGKLSMDDISNYDEIRTEIVKRLTDMRDNPLRNEEPLIYHLDVAAMYPNIILTNRLQPNAVIDEGMCAACDFNEGPQSSCQRPMTWLWRGEYFPASRGELNMIRNQIEQEKFPHTMKGETGLTTVMKQFGELRLSEQSTLLTKRVSEYSRKVYGRAHETKVVTRESIVCQREHPFYVNTVRDFRDRRYEYKGLLKTWKNTMDEAAQSNDLPLVDEAKRMIVIFDSLQLAHKCILNSFYGYVMRKGARWYSMEMAGIVCLTGAKIIQLARSRVEKLGRPLELDTDGIWCMLPRSFPENFSFKLKNGKNFFISYPCVMLNHLVHAEFTNHQYQDLVDGKYKSREENSIFFEVDGPYRAMILPASTEEDRLLKKRYAVFNHDKTLAELKGFEVKRRGELKLIKNFQSSIFKVFLEGSSLQECYSSVGASANRWLDVLYSKAVDLSDSELIDLISENRSMSKSLKEYGAQKSTSITTAKRLAELLGEQMVKDKGLACKFIISAKPPGLPVSERAVPVAIFQSAPAVRKHFLRKWLKDSVLQDPDIRDVLDWGYYIERFGSVIQKLITIPAAMQLVDNPVPRVRHPDWLSKRVAEQEDRFKQRKIMELFKPLDKDEIEAKRMADRSLLMDIEGSVNKENADVDLNHTGGKDSTQEQPHEPYLWLTDYSSWLRSARLKWRQVRIGRSFGSKRQILGGKRRLGSSRRFFSTGSISSSATVQILQIAETDIPGSYQIWMISNGFMHSTRLEVPRSFYLNSKVANPGTDMPDHPLIKIKKCVRTLPRSHNCRNLYHFEMPESFYVKNITLFSTLANHPDVDGLYETQVTPLFRSLLRVGCISTITKTTNSELLPRNIELGAIKSDPTITKASYLPAGQQLQFHYLYHASSGSRQVLGLFVIPLAKCHVIVIDPGKNADGIPNVTRIYNEATEQFSQDRDGVFEYTKTVEFTTNVYATEREGFTALNAILRAQIDRRRYPTLLVMQSCHSRKYMENYGMYALRDTPVLSVPNHKNDDAFPALGWQTYSLRRMVAHYFNLNEFLVDRIELSRYADVPICNIENDYTLFVNDLFFARRLVQSDVVLWYSQSDKPDLGGVEQQESYLSQEMPVNPEINSDIACHTICVELDIWDLALNTVLQSALLHDMENPMSGADTHVVALTSLEEQFSVLAGGNGAGDKDGESTALISADLIDTNTISPKIYGVFKSMVKALTEEVRRRNQLASQLLEHLFRWIMSPSATFFDPQLYRLFHNLMKRVFDMLIGQIVHFGADIVYASFEKIVINTNKTVLRNSLGYVSYVIAAIGKKDTFEHIEIKPTRFWKYLMWMDQFNWGGVEYSNIESLHNALVAEDPQGADGGKNDTEIITDIDMRWGIAEILPTTHRETFMRTLTEYLHGLPDFDQKDKEAWTKSADKLLSKLKRALLKTVSESIKTVSANVDDENAEQDEFSHSVSSKLSGSAANVEFVKLLIAVLSLDSLTEKSILLLRRDLLSCIGLKEFSKKAEVVRERDPLILSQIICEYCNFCRDLDLTRDTIDNQSHDEDGTDGNKQQQGFWRCSACHMEYDKSHIEHQLISLITNTVTAWQLQDIQCTSCKFIVAEDLRSYCARCTGKVKTKNERGAVSRTIGHLRRISKVHGMETLSEISDLLTQLN